MTTTPKLLISTILALASLAAPCFTQTSGDILNRSRTIYSGWDGAEGELTIVFLAFVGDSGLQYVECNFTERNAERAPYFDAETAPQRFAALKSMYESGRYEFYEPKSLSCRWTESRFYLNTEALRSITRNSHTGAIDTVTVLSQFEVYGRNASPDQWDIRVTKTGGAASFPRTFNLTRVK